MIGAMQTFMLQNEVAGPSGSQSYAKVPDGADGFTGPSEAACVPYDGELLP